MKVLALMVLNATDVLAECDRILARQTILQIRKQGLALQMLNGVLVYKSPQLNGRPYRMDSPYPHYPSTFARIRRNTPEHAGTRWNTPEHATTRRNTLGHAGARRNAPERA